MSPAAKALRNCSVMSTSAWLTMRSFLSLSRHQQEGAGDGAATHAGQGHLGTGHLPVPALAPQLQHCLGQLPETMQPATPEVPAVGADRQLGAEPAPALGKPRPGLTFLHEAEV